MRLLKAVLLMFSFATGVFAADTSALHGVYVGDINKSVNPCVNFFDYANGAWRKQNPIPASMVRLSRGRESGETNKDVLHGIVDETAAQSGSAKGGCTDQRVGDYYAAGRVDSAV